MTHSGIKPVLSPLSARASLFPNFLHQRQHRQPLPRPTAIPSAKKSLWTSTLKVVVEAVKARKAKGSSWTRSRTRSAASIVVSSATTPKNERTTRKYDIRAMSSDEKRALLDELAEVEEYENF